MANTDKRKRHITAGEIITVVIVVLCLTAGLAFSFWNFTENAYINTVKNGAIKAYSAISALNIRVENNGTSADGYADVTDEFFPDIFEFGATEDSLKDSATNGKLKDGGYAVSAFSRSASGFTFTYYQFLNGKLYAVQYNQGIMGKVEVIFEPNK